MKGKSRVRSVMRLLGPVLLVWIIWRFADLPVLVDTFAHAAPGPIIAAILLNAIVIHAKLWRWRDLLGAVDVPLGIAEAYRAFLPSLYLGLLTPGRVGDALRIQYLKRDHAVGYSDGLAVSIVDRLCDVYVLLAFVAFG
ncbi:MAG: lysylphosphatidylglycerol synthase transmembrane domain-containing protein, partial [Polyangiales bacterium]